MWHEPKRAQTCSEADMDAQSLCEVMNVGNEMLIRPLKGCPAVCKVTMFKADRDALSLCEVLNVSNGMLIRLLKGCLALRKVTMFKWEDDRGASERMHH